MASALHQLGSYLPPDDGLLSKWLLFISVVSIGNSVQAYFSLAGTREVYAGPVPVTAAEKAAAKKDSLSPVTDLSARTFGTWTALSAIIRLYAAYNITNAVVYELALWTFGLAWIHFATEWLVFGTARWGRGLAGPVCVATGTGAWMLAQWGSYVQ
ncbi:ergosterol 28 [Acrodontium crateriforme]|uniref:Ergosterol 28 n=1 Tax=Acrodontium crateriforme TaxID=150365 RepID=A0AAQ3M026_9PEZI|nr:ergosterol 28 [Acrodontium crateriforme]